MKKKKGKPRGRPFQPGNPYAAKPGTQIPKASSKPGEKPKPLNLQELLIADLREGKTLARDWWDGFNELATKYLGDHFFVLPETRKILMPLLEMALREDLVRGSGRNKARNLYESWLRQ